MKTIEQHMANLTARAVEVSQDVRIHTGKKTGHQGDVYVHPIKAKPAAWSTENTDQSRQLATGQTVGSRHCAEGPVQVFWPASTEAAVAGCPVSLYTDDAAAQRECIGPVVVATGPWTLTHPEHAHHQFPAGCYFVSYQLDRVTMRRVVD